MARRRESRAGDTSMALRGVLSQLLNLPPPSPAAASLTYSGAHKQKAGEVAFSTHNDLFPADSALRYDPSVNLAHLARPEKQHLPNPYAYRLRKDSSEQLPQNLHRDNYGAQWRCRPSDPPAPPAHPTLTDCLRAVRLGKHTRGCTTAERRYAVADNGRGTGPTAF